MVAAEDSIVWDAFCGQGLGSKALVKPEVLIARLKLEPNLAILTMGWSIFIIKASSLSLSLSLCLTSLGLSQDLPFQAVDWML